ATANHQYAIEAFEAHAIDYVLKPFDPARIAKTLQRVREALRRTAPERQDLVSLEDHFMRKGMIRKLAGHRRNSRDRIVIDPSDVYFFTARLAEVVAQLGTQELIVNATLKDILAQHGERFAQT